MPQTAETIRDQMHQVRRDMGEDMVEIVESTRELTDWRVYVRQYPWICLGGAALIGYLVVPKRLELVSPDADTLMELAKRNKLVVKTNPEPHARNGVAGPAFNFLANAAMRGAIAYVGQLVGKKGGRHAAEESD